MVQILFAAWIITNLPSIDETTNSVDFSKIWFPSVLLNNSDCPTS